jgi:superfamily II DNA or RNA helicase
MEGICESSIQDSTAMVKSRFRYYQQEADDAISLNEDKRCVVVMFCGTGKSLVMRYCKIVQDKQLVVYVFPSLSLIEQFHSSYLMDFDQVNLLKVSSDEESESTTDYDDIMSFLCKSDNKIVCVTYKSYETLTCCLGDNRIDVCIYDEAHHVVGEKYQQAILDTDYCDKQVFFTATPRNANGIVMMDTNQPDIGVCGEVVYKYNYFRGVMEGYLNAFDVRIDFYSENTNNSVYESIARAILASGNSRVLTFHADVNGDRDTSVLNFVVEPAFIAAFDKVLYTEFEEKVGFYKSVKMVAFHSKMKTKCACCRRPNYCVSSTPCCRFNVLNYFDSCLDDEVFVIASCQTLGEGIDTKRANMVVFVDPKSSVVGIMQNIGRIVRKLFGEDKPNSTILLAEWVDKEKYLECEGDPDKRDEVIRTNLNKGGDFSNILNVFCALKQQDENLFDSCLNYCNTFSPQEIERNLANHGFKIVEEEPSYLADTLGKVLGEEIEDYEDLDDEEMLEQAAEENDVCIEVHSDSLENPVTTYNPQAKDVVRIFKSTDEEENEVYQPIVRTHDGKTRTTDQIPRPKKRFNVKVHTSPDIKMLWKIQGDDNDLEFSKDVCSCIIECEVVDMWFQRFEEADKLLSNGEKPHWRSTLSHWIYHQQRSYKTKNFSMKDQKKYDLWTQFLEKHKEHFLKCDFELKWYENFEEADKLLSDGEKPSSKKSGLGMWIRTQNANHTNKNFSMKDQKKYDLWTQFLEKHKEHFPKCDFELKWYENFEEADKLLSKGEKPHHRALLRSWINNQQKNYKKKNQSMKDQKKYDLWTQFLEKHKEHFLKCDFKLKWYEDFEEADKLLSDGEKPSSKKSGLGMWIRTQNANHTNKNFTMKDQKKYDLWTQFLKKHKEHFLKCDFKLKWYENFEEAYKLLSNGEKPLSKTQLGTWIKTQNANHKNKIFSMKDQKKYDLWTDFLLENKEHFPNYEIEQPHESVSTKRKPQTKSAKLPATKKAKEEEEKETVEEFRTRTKSQISQYHNKFCKMRSENMALYFQENPQEFVEYHRVRDENFQTYDPADWPYNRIIMELEKIKSNRRRSVVDMGCGTAKISAHFQADRRFQFTNYDHVAINETVQVCDITRMPLEDNLVDICVMSLCLWGPNKDQSVSEAFRVLDTNGTLYLIDSTMRWSNTDELGNIVGTAAQRLGELLLGTGFQIASHNVEDKFCMFICVKK